MRHFYMAFLLVFCLVGAAHADVASVSYVENIAKDKVSTKGEATQTMSGTYVVTGSFQVPTPQLPSAVVN